MELWNDIFRHVERRNLATLARVSRLFQQEAEYVLYHHINLRDTTDGARLASWSMSIVGERRRASRLHTLRFPGHFKLPPDDLGDSGTKIQQLIAQAFRAAVNLKELYIFRQMAVGPGVPTIVPSTLESCTFRLTGIAGFFPGLTADEMLDFLSTQSDISYWIPSTRLIQSVDALPSNALPSIREMLLARPKKLSLFYDRPIQKLWLTFGDAEHVEHDGLAVIHSLRRFKDTLRVLSYMVFGSLTDWETLDVVRSLAKDAPNLELLAMRFQNTVSFRDSPRRFTDNPSSWY
jgi:hypothetical protein